MIIGRGGAHIRDIESKYRVEIVVDKKVQQNQPDKKKIAVYGGRKEDVERAKEELYLERVEIPVEEKMLEFICGQNENNLRYLEEKTGVF